MIIIKPDASINVNIMLVRVEDLIPIKFIKLRIITRIIAKKTFRYIEDILNKSDR